MSLGMLASGGNGGPTITSSENLFSTKGFCSPFQSARTKKKLIRRTDRDFLHSDYGLVAGVKMLNFFRFFGETGLIVIGILVLASVFVQNFWCRYLCPYGGCSGFASLLSPVRIRREPEACIDCAKWAKVCPSNLPVDKLATIKSAECTGRLECVAICPAEGALHLALPQFSQRPKRIPSWAIAAGIAVLFFGIVGYTKAVGLWESHVPAVVYRQLVPHASQARHPMPGDPEISLRHTNLTQPTRSASRPGALTGILSDSR